MKKEVEKSYDRTAVEQARETADSIAQDPAYRQVLDQFSAGFTANSEYNRRFLS